VAVELDLRLRKLLRAEPNDPGCDISTELFAEYAEATVANVATERLFRGVAAHLRACPACRADVEGLIDAITVFGDPAPAVRSRRGEQLIAMLHTFGRR
jgi:hypothetical protein